MPKRPSTESHLALLRQLRAAPDSPQTLPALEQLLASPHPHGIVLKSAAALAEQLNAKSLAPAFIAACQALLAFDAAKRDPGCEAKTAIMNTLLAWESDAADLYLALARYTQFEPTFGDPVDSAAQPRGLAALGLAMTRPPNAILLLADLLTDPEKNTRALAASALGIWRGPEALPLLHLKARLGDADPETFAEVLGSLLKHDPEHHLAFVADFLHASSQQIIEAAALALGQSKLASALAPLVAVYPKLRHSGIATTLLMAISLLRTPEAIDWLLVQLPRATPPEALNLLDALHLHHHDEKLIAKLQTLLTQYSHLENPYHQIFIRPRA